MTKPALNPIEAPDLVCTECGKVLRRVIKTRDSNGKLDEIIYHCDSPKCQYAMSISKEHKNAQNAKYEPDITNFSMPVTTGTRTFASTYTSQPDSVEAEAKSEAPSSGE
jgi:hypothetical protein